ncbi:hypothetical protein A2U01_0101137, partial [Trifolium medium]|nr:hypothetical protein [Trifolium medium]
VQKKEIELRDLE